MMAVASGHPSIELASSSVWIRPNLAQIDYGSGEPTSRPPDWPPRPLPWDLPAPHPSAAEAETDLHLKPGAGCASRSSWANLTRVAGCPAWRPQPPLCYWNWIWAGDSPNWRNTPCGFAWPSSTKTYPTQPHVAPVVGLEPADVPIAFACAVAGKRRKSHSSRPRPTRTTWPCVAPPTIARGARRSDPPDPDPRPTTRPTGTTSRRRTKAAWDCAH